MLLVPVSGMNDFWPQKKKKQNYVLQVIITIENPVTHFF